MIQNNKNDFKSKILTKDESLSYLLFKITIRVELYLFLLTGVLILFYIFGNFQGVLDRNQRITLNLLFISSTALIIFSLICIALNTISWIAVKRKAAKVAMYYFLFLIALTVSIISILFSRSVLFLANGF
ncbi:MAG: hypothetical protein MJ169_00090 [Treponema sp.]|nr:hypothetical protein [Treponema sp.]